MQNEFVRNYARSKNIALYRVAKSMGISDMTMTRLLREELNEQKRSDIIRIIDELAYADAQRLMQKGAQ